MRYFATASAITLAASSPVWANTKTTEEVLAEAERYTVQVDVINAIGLNMDEGGNAFGTGFLIDKDRGWLLTNAHVATRSPSSIEVIFKGAEPISARRIHVDPVLDLAVLEIDASHIPKEAKAAELECDSLASAGAPVLAYGHPGGFRFTGSRGIVSGYTDRYIPSHFLMTDAQIDSGSSGGPLIRTDDGKVVGINTAAVENENLSVSFAEPTPPVCRVLELLERGEDAGARHLNLGLATMDYDTRPVVATIYGEQPNLLPGDLIAHVQGGAQIENYADLLDQLRGAGETVELTIERSGEPITVLAQTYQVPDPLAAKAVDIAGLVISEAWLLDDPLVNTSYNLSIHFIDYDRLAGTTEAEVGSRLVSADGEAFHSSKDLFDYLSGLPEDQEVRLVLRSEIYSDLAYFTYHIVELPVGDVRLLHADGAAD